MKHHILPPKNQILISSTALGCRAARLRKAADSIFHEIGIKGIFPQDLAHPFQDLCMKVTWAFTKVSRYFALYHFTVDQMPFAVYFKDAPYMAG